MPTIGPMELIVVLVVALILLGPKRLPEAGRSLGRSLREFKASIGGEEDREPGPAVAEMPAAAGDTAPARSPAG